MTTILVTGATGNVGAHVVDELRRRGVRVRAFVRDAARARARWGDGVELAVGDFGDAAAVRRALAGADRVFLASPNSPQQVEHETDVIDAAVALGARRIVKLTTPTARVGAPVAFWHWQGCIEEHLLRAPTPSVLVQASFFMTNLLAAAAQVARDGALVAPAGAARIAMVDPRDVAAVAAVALTDAAFPARVHVTGPEAVTYERVAEALTSVTGRRVRFVDAPDAAAREGLRAAGAPDWFAEPLVTLFAMLRRGAAERVTDTVRAVTGRTPRTIEEFLRDHAAAFAPADVAAARPS
jgi:uncharacterized protein YbjT (DUF2867 family)